MMHRNCKSKALFSFHHNIREDTSDSRAIPYEVNDISLSETEPPIASQPHDMSEAISFDQKSNIDTSSSHIQKRFLLLGIALLIFCIFSYGSVTVLLKQYPEKKIMFEMLQSASLPLLLFSLLSFYLSYKK